MAIEKMVLVSIEGALKRVNRTLLKCCESNCFHIVSSGHDYAGNYSSTSFKTLKDKNIYAPLLRRGVDIANQLGFEIVREEYDDVDYIAGIDFTKYFDEIDLALKTLFTRKKELEKNLTSHSQALMQVEQLAGMDTNFEDIFACKYVKVRFGRLPADSYPKLKYFEDRSFLFFPFEKNEDFIWGVYFTPNLEAAEVDDIFKSMFFERIRMPDYFRGTADEAKSSVLRLIVSESEQLDDVNSALSAYANRNEEDFLKVLSKLKALNDSYELRSNVSVINNKFYVIGFVPKKEVEGFCKLISEIEGVSTQVKPHDSDPTLSPPIRLKNNWLFKPFEMFTEMYGLPCHNGVDPTPYVAISYILMFGIMFGDLGQGILISLLGIFFTKVKKAKLGPIMTRIGVSSAFFGVLYGSVFGIETLITPIFHNSFFYKAIGMQQAPENIFEISFALLLFTMGIGVVLILISMTFNIIINIKNGNYETALLGPNGINGFVLYSAIIFGAAFQIGMGVEMFTTPYVLCLIVLPVLILFFKEPLAHFIEKVVSQRRGMKFQKSSALVHSIISYSDAISELSVMMGNNIGLDEFLADEHIKYQYGKMTIENYKKLDMHDDKLFFFFPFESDNEFVSGVYLAPRLDFPIVEKLFASFDFKKMKMPDHISDFTKESSMRFLDDFEVSRKEKKSVGTFIVEGFIELFECALTYVSNTMSFLRIGGFVLSHAGMMLVVSVLAETAGGFGSIIVMIIGNLFVIGMEGFLVGIQALRLEFYEIFSRFYVGDGKPFKPIVIDMKFENN